MSRGAVFMNPLHEGFGFDHSPFYHHHFKRFPRSASCHSRSLSPHMRRRSVDSLEIPSSYVHVQESVGKGYFGNVYKGVLRDPMKGTYSPVAIKSLKSEILYERGNVDDFLKEGLMMKNLDHPNIMKLQGICYSSDGIPSLIMPFMNFGDLRSYVSDPHRTVCLIEVVDFSQQIAEGMTYLSSMGIVHRDLAARNIMLTDSYTIKIADFGLAVDLSRDFGRRDHEMSSSPLRLALKWLPIEVLRNRRCVHSSVDVWSFGVVMWELLTRACPPYEELSNSDLEWYLQTGKRLHQPVHCPNVLYDMMLACWRSNPVSRPRFISLAKQLGNLMNHEIEHARRYGRQGPYFQNIPCGQMYLDNIPLRYSS
ncbi:unnamed protein product [Bursaphelenchus xylophilus]|uniref:receptor protein-tyrosine kinase n=1 Tax=Bursaphelenchus xylophilus TaxID=6326 RepID=A0A1I7S4Q0_BURXY|nr:unnamed protein product [Bursaphelenchus xylophilus]CAG9117287.1 unnamed protein product [Bursaphelenchus xylophilus]